MKKQDKLALIEQLLLNHPEGLKRADIAKKIGAHRSTAGRCIDDLTHMLPIMEEDKLLFIDRSRYLNNVKLTLHEVFSLYLAARLLFLTFNRYSPHVYSSMNKLAEALETVFPLLGDFIHASARHLLSQAGTQWKEKTAVLEMLTVAWAENQKVILKYRSKKAGGIHAYTASIYFMEPYPAGKTVYIFARTDEDGLLRTFRTDRIMSAEMTKNKYSVPDDFSFQELFTRAWGVWDSGGEPETVKLRFSPRVAERVAETVWHPSQKITGDKAGCLRFTALIAEPLEMVPWIRGWGSDCEVLEPASLREFMKEEVKKMGAMYG